MELKDLLTKKGRETLIFFLGIVLIQFIFAWDALDRVTTLPYTEDLLENYTVYYFIRLWSLLIDIGFQAGDNFLRSMGVVLNPADPVFYWGWFLIQQIFNLLFLLVGFKLDMRKTPLYITILTMAGLRYGYWDYFTHPNEGITFIICLGIYYYYKTGNKKMYYVLTVMGALQREFCLFINLWVILDRWKQENYKIRPIFTSKFIKENLFELIVMVAYVAFRTTWLLTFWGDYPGAAVWRAEDPLAYLLNPKEWFHVPLMFGYLWYYWAKSKDWRLYILVAFIFATSALFAFPFEVNHVVSVFFLIHYEIPEFKKGYKKPPEITTTGKDETSPAMNETKGLI